MFKSLLLTTMLGATMACAAAAHPDSGAKQMSSRYDAPVSCEITETRTRHGLRLEATAFSDGAPLYGEYEFVMTKRDSGGSSDMVQGGEFDFSASDRQDLGVVEVSLERGARYSARLILRDADGLVCEAETRT